MSTASPPWPKTSLRLSCYCSHELCDSFFWMSLNRNLSDKCWPHEIYPALQSFASRGLSFTRRSAVPRPLSSSRFPVSAFDMFLSLRLSCTIKSSNFLKQQGVLPPFAVQCLACTGIRSEPAVNTSVLPEVSFLVEPHP